MTRYWFEHWKDGKNINWLMVEAETVTQAVSNLSDEHKGVFLLIDQQTEEQRNRENWLEFYRVSGES